MRTLRLTPMIGNRLHIVDFPEDDSYPVDQKKPIVTMNQDEGLGRTRCGMVLTEFDLAWWFEPRPDEVCLPCRNCLKGPP